MKKALIVLPTYNEKENIHILIPRLQEVIKSISGWVVEILIVDDNSPDGTYDEAVELKGKFHNIHVIKGRKEGLGKAYLRGFEYGIAHVNPFVIVQMDADCQHSPNLIPSFLTAIEEGGDFVIGSRYIKGGSIPRHWTIDRKFYSIVGNLVAKIGFMNFAINDWTSGYRAMKAWFLKEVIDKLQDHNGYEFQIALVDKAIKRHLVIKEIPLQFIDRNVGDSKLNSKEFIPRALVYILKNSSFIKFAVVGFLGFIVDFIIAAFLIHSVGVYTPTANALSAECAIIFNFFVNNAWSFSHKKVNANVASYITKLVTFNIVSSGSIVIQSLGIYALINLFGEGGVTFVSYISIPSWIIYKIFLIVCLIIPYSYFMYNRFIWKKPQE